MYARSIPQFLKAPQATTRIFRKPRQRKRPIGQVLVDSGALLPGDMLKAAAICAREDARFGDVVLAHGMVNAAQLAQGLATQFNCEIADIAGDPPDVRLLDDFGIERCIKLGLIPWKSVGGAIVFVASRPDEFASILPELVQDYGHVRMAVAQEREIQTQLVALRRRFLAQKAEQRVAQTDSCRTWQTARVQRWVLAAMCVAATGLLINPGAMVVGLSIWAILTLIVNTVLKLATLVTMRKRSHPKRLRFKSNRSNGKAAKLPVVSILVPLFREKNIASNLVRRLAKLTYPKELLDICLIVEEDDTVTQATLASSSVPDWMRQLTVPRGSLKTKPRALNFALDFCRGSIVGVYDAEDAPEPDQIHKIVKRFSECDEKVACLQGVLDFYNPKQNWLSRCFTIEYATWFRIVLPGLQRLGFAIPLGGTTLFFRRNILEELGGWDAHNVTEDADLGIRLARNGYRTELVPTVTYEEANCRYWPWIKQRSRWLKGYAMTWAVHMRSPGRLWRELGPWKFLGFQLLFVGTISQFILAPLLWTFWAIPLGLPHPMRDVLSDTGFIILAATFIGAEVVTLAVGTFAVVEKQRRRGLWLWVPTLHFYFPLGALAAYKAFWEIIRKPFYWDKTNHGVSHPN